MVTCRPSLTTTSDTAQTQAMSRITEISTQYSIYDTWCVAGQCVQHNNVIANEEVQKTKESTFLICSSFHSYTTHAPKTMANSLLPPLPFHLPTPHALASGDLHYATHLYLTNRCLITRTAILPSCIWYRYSYGYSHAVPATGCVSTVYGSETTQKHSILPVSSDIIISHFMAISGSPSPKRN